MPAFTLWKNTSAVEDGYVAGLEPATNYPNPKPFEREHGRVIRLNGGDSHRIDLSVAVHDSRRTVRDTERAIRRIGGSGPSKVHPNPIRKLSSAA